MALISEACKFMEQNMAHYDTSHDKLHVYRVRDMALKFAESVNANKRVVELAALFHDLLDHKYNIDSENDKVTSGMRELMAQNGVDSAEADLVMRIVDNTGFSKEKKLRQSGQWMDWHESCKELHCVQDADRIDAIGAIGVFRAAAYASAKGQPLIDPSNPKSCLHHYDDKLLILKDHLKTDLGKRIGLKRHDIMEQVAKHAREEYELADF